MEIIETVLLSVFCFLIGVFFLYLTPSLTLNPLTWIHAFICVFFGLGGILIASVLVLQLA
jgi:hypothetical protein